ELPEPPAFGGTDLSHRNDQQKEEKVRDDLVFERTDLSTPQTGMSDRQTDLSGVTVPELANGGSKNLSKNSLEESSSSPSPLQGSVVAPAVPEDEEESVKTSPPAVPGPRRPAHFEEMFEPQHTEEDD